MFGVTGPGVKGFLWVSEPRLLEGRGVQGFWDYGVPREPNTP